MPIYLPLTKRWEDSKSGVRIINTIKRYLLRVKNFYKYRQGEKLFQEIIKRIDYVAPVFRNEMEVLNGIKGFRAQYFPFQYTRWSLNDDFGWKTEGQKRYILVGNSGFSINNHLDVIDILRKRNITSYPLYLPVAYGNEDYVRMLKMSLESLNVNCVFQDMMLPYPVYQQNMRECAVVVIGSIRQHASDTIYMNLLQGAKVFLYEKSMAYKYLKSEGLRVYSIDHDMTSENIEENLSLEDKLINRKKVLELVSKERTTERLQKALDALV